MKYLLLTSAAALLGSVAWMLYDHYTTYIEYQGVRSYNVPGSMHGLGYEFGPVIFIISLIPFAYSLAKVVSNKSKKESHGA